jgi:hypothetical protein
MKKRILSIMGTRLSLLLGGCLLALAPNTGFAQGGFMIASGTQVVCDLSPSIVITDGRWVNDGNFTAATSLVEIEGTATTANSTIGGTSSTTFHHLTQQKTLNDIRLLQNIGVNGNFTMGGGLFQLNNFNVVLGSASGQIVNETELNRVTGTTGGEISKTMVLNAPAAVNPGNLGAIFTSAANMGSTTVERGHVQQTDGNSGLSIQRYFDITPTNNAGLNATLRQQYFDAELAGRVESELVHYSSLNGGFSWYNRSFTSRNTVANTVDQTGFGDIASRWTLASPINQPLPVEFLSDGIRCEDDAAVYFWTVLETQSSDYFQVEKSTDEVEWTEVADGRISSQGAGRNHYEYAMSESENYFRVRQYDVDGGSNQTESHRLTCNVAGAWTIWPTLADDQISVRAPFGKEIAAIEVTDLLGQVLLHKDVPATSSTQYTVDLTDQLSAAIYLIKVFPKGGNPIVKKFEVRR